MRYNQAWHVSTEGALSHLLQEVNGGLEVEAEIDEGPVDALSLVLLLLQDEHGVVEELLQLLIGVVDAQLLKRVQLKRESQQFIVHFIKMTLCILHVSICLYISRLSLHVEVLLYQKEGITETRTGLTCDHMVSCLLQNQVHMLYTLLLYYLVKKSVE